MYKFVKAKRKFVWRGSEYGIEFFDPVIETHGVHEIVENTHDIMYYYYTMQIVKYNDSGKARTVNKTFVYDFPSIFSIMEIIEGIIDAKPDKNWQITHTDDGDEIKSYSQHVWGFINDDYMFINKTSYDNKMFYDMFMGGSCGCSNNHICIHLSAISDDDLKELFSCLKAFVDYSIEEENKATKNLIKACRKNKEILFGKIFTHEISGKNYRISDYCDNIYIPGDVIYSMEVYHDDGRIEDIAPCTIKAIDEDSVTMECYRGSEIPSVGDAAGNNIFKFPIEDIIELNCPMDDKKIYYDINEIAQDFVSILSSDEKDLLRGCSAEEIAYKYGMVLVQRYYMCREEHPYHKNGQMYLEDIIKDVIPKITNIIKKLI